MIYDRNSSFEKVDNVMHLRAPQREALKTLHDILSRTDKFVNEMGCSEITELFKEQHPSWEFDHETPEFTFHLATGVGKTRLVGAIIAYLHLCGDTKNFMIVTPRAEIIRKFISVCTTDDDNYLFVDQSLVDFPAVFTVRDSVRQYEESNLFTNSPIRIWILSPQAFTANNARLKNAGEQDPKSPVDYFKELDDLVIFFDESHHLGLDRENDSIWRSELNSLSPKMIIGTTASISEEQNNIIYSYDLKTCLNEHKYTKFVRMIPDRRISTLSEQEYDFVTLRFGLNQLNIKQKYLDNYCLLNEGTHPVKAAMLVACENIQHAEEVTKWLQNELGNKDKVLLVHSNLNANEFVPRLKMVEDVNSPTKVIVNVGMLNEGWDVSNIYVITPLRAMASTTLVTQIMGRGLRLPYGKQVGDDEVDTLDVLCFGRETMEEIMTKLTKEGFGTGEHGGITIEPKATSAPSQDDFVPKKKVNLKVVRGESKLSIPRYAMHKEQLPLDLVSIPAIKPQETSYFLINDLQTVKKLGDIAEYNRVDFINLVTNEVIKKCSYLKFARHFSKIRNVIDRFLDNSNFKGDTIKLDPSRVVAHIVENLNKLDCRQEVSYSPLEESLIIDLETVQIVVPESFDEPLSNLMLSSEWVNKKHKGIPFSGWHKSVYDAVPFDNKYEYKIAKIIDHAEEVKSWMRNLPGIITLATPIGNYSPDFAIVLNLDDKNVLLELKDDDRFGREDQDATIKAKAARSWCQAQTLASGIKWEYWLLLTSDSEDCESFSDIEDSSDIED